MNRAVMGRWFDGAVIALLLAASILLQSGAIAKPPATTESRSVAVLFAPWVGADSAMERVAATGARIVGFGALPFIVIVEPQEADFQARVSAAGSWFTIDATSFWACMFADRAS